EDDTGAHYDYSKEGSPDRVPDLRAAEWLGVRPHPKFEEHKASSVAILTDRFDHALIYATYVHGGQTRKGTSTPYVAHLLAVASTVLEYGGSEDVVIAALLHDAVEDQGGEPRLFDIRNRF